MHQLIKCQAKSPCNGLKLLAVGCAYLGENLLIVFVPVDLFACGDSHIIKQLFYFGFHPVGWLRGATQHYIMQRVRYAKVTIYSFLGCQYLQKLWVCCFKIAFEHLVYIVGFC